MTSPSPSTTKPVVVLGVHQDDALNVFIRSADGSLNQAARIASHNGLDPAAMTAVMADLADVFGWRHIAAAPVPKGVPHTPSGELPRARTGVAAPVRASTPDGQSKRKYTKAKNHRRTADQIATLVERIRLYVSTIPREDAVISNRVVDFLAEHDPTVNPKTIDSMVRGKLLALHADGAIEKYTDNAGRHRWYQATRMVEPVRLPADLLGPSTATHPSNPDASAG